MSYLFTGSGADAVASAPHIVSGLGLQHGMKRAMQRGDTPFISANAAFNTSRHLDWEQGWQDAEVRRVKRHRIGDLTRNVIGASGGLTK